MIEDMQIRGTGETTQTPHVRAIAVSRCELPAKLQDKRVARRPKSPAAGRLPRPALEIADIFRARAARAGAARSQLFPRFAAWTTGAHRALARYRNSPLIV